MPAKSNLNKVSDNERNNAAQTLPHNWPKDQNVAFLTDLTYSPAVTADLRTALGRTTAESATYPKIPAESLYSTVSITTISDEKHPACGQRGLFAALDLEPDAFICLYLGHVHMNSLSDTDPHSDYDLNLDRDLGLSVDAVRSGNESRFANDYRGVAERPNAEFRDCLIQVPSGKRADGVKWERRVGLFVLSSGKAGKRKAGVKAGTEVLLSYGKSYWEARQVIAKFRKDSEMLRVAEAALNG